MPNQPETATYDSAIYQLQSTDPCQGAVSGGSSGVLNTPLLSLANRTGWLKAQIATLIANLAGYALINSPTFTGTPAAPTPPAGDNSGALATTAFVQSETVGTLLVVQGFSGTANYTVPAGKTLLKVRIWGGGGAGGNGNSGCGDGGSGGGYGEGFLTVTPGQVIAYSVGQASSSSVNNGLGNGSTFGPSIVAYGGQSGSPGVSGGVPANNANTAQSSTCVFPGGWVQHGAEGGKGDDRAAASSVTGGGAPSFGGRGGVQLPRIFAGASVNGNSGTMPGSGGSGGAGTGSGGPGAAGLLIIEC